MDNAAGAIVREDVLCICELRVRGVLALGNPLQALGGSESCVFALPPRMGNGLGPVEAAV